jgi:hypothetical protein
MAYCPHCGVEYREGTAQCMDCRIPLKPGLPPENFKERAKKDEHPQLTRIRIFSGPTAVMEADLARNLLEAEGIPCILPGEYTAEMLPGVEPIQVFVRESDAEQAREILQAYFDTPQAETSD